MHYETGTQNYDWSKRNETKTNNKTDGEKETEKLCMIYNWHKDDAKQ